jgi:hypothetical protein
METLTANGVDLSSLVWNVTDLAGLIRTPPRRGENLTVAGRHGQLRRRNKLYDQNEFVLPMWVVGANPFTGSVPSNFEAGASEFLANVEQLVKIFTTETVVLDHTRPDGSVRRAVCEVNQIFDPSRILGGPITGKIDVPLVMPDPFWTDVDETIQTFEAETMETLVLDAFADATAPISDLTIEFGPGSNPELSQLYAASYIAWDEIIDAGHKLILSTGQWAATPGDGTPWNPDLAKLRHGGLRGPWFQITPEPDGPPELIFTHTGGGTMNVTITARRRYLTG